VNQARDKGVYRPTYFRTQLVQTLLSYTLELAGSEKSYGKCNFSAYNNSIKDNVPEVRRQVKMERRAV
jgi:hypothetical protein